MVVKIPIIQMRGIVSKMLPIIASKVFAIGGLMLILGLFFGFSLGVKNGRGSIDDLMKAEDTRLTAREAFDMGLVKARLWQQDTALAGIRMNGREIKEDGKASGWDITFYSPNLKSGYKVLVKDGEVRSAEVTRWPETTTLKGAWVDSSSVMAKADASVGNDIVVTEMNLSYLKEQKRWQWSINHKDGNITFDAEK